ncbi:hypothetical protein J3F83DRAFT_747152 [Trichoderma novae-zelandiae]
MFCLVFFFFFSPPPLAFSSPPPVQSMSAQHGVDGTGLAPRCPATRQWRNKQKHPPCHFARLRDESHSPKTFPPSKNQQPTAATYQTIFL